MTKYHIKKDGTPGICRAAEGNCPLGSEAKHYATKEEAETVAQANFEKEFGVIDVDEMHNERYRRLVEDGEEYSMREALERADWVEKKTSEALENGQSSVDLYTKNGIWSKERAELHEKILSEFEEKYKNVPSEGKVVFSAGLPGAGKTTVLTQSMGLSQDDYVTVSSDDFKEALAEEGAVPEIDGLTPMESSTLVHLESSQLADEFLHRMGSQNKNIIYDFTCKNEETGKRRAKALENLGYDTSKMQYVFVDVKLETSLERTKSRYKYGLNKGGVGGRYLPEDVLYKSKAQNPDKFHSRNAEAISALSKDKELNLPEPIVFDNSGNKPKELNFSDFKNGLTN